MHLLHAVKSGFSNTCIRTVDTDVVIIAISLFHELERFGLKKLTILFGAGKTFKTFSIDTIAKTLLEKKCVALRGFHALTGCDSVSFFNGIGKKTFFNRWRSCEEVTEALLYISTPHNDIPDNIFGLIETYIISCYCATASSTEINKARLELFTSRQKSIESIPPTKNALKQHIGRAAYQAGHVWGQSLISNPALPDVSKWGWISQPSGLVPNWTDQSEISSALRELVKCGCKKGCKSGCSCRKMQLCCTLMCKNCSGTCTNV